MPRLSVWAIRLALLYLLFGFTFGALMLAGKGLALWPWAWAFFPAHMEFLLIGWMVQFAFGMAYWILPRYAGGSRGQSAWALAAVIALNLGVLLVGLQVPFQWPSFTLLAGRILETLAVALFAAYAWGRVRPTYPPTGSK